ncbi:hypothetical protein [Mycolicibacterium chlorophenolicum]|uniref:hypothetical protein n=1 Tax=Mycolicibacterium chlorophenolicum TaxID=37916 RepID=UPI0012E356F3|nr:hypothetical protein [Mycolicibacterium chlorophenolicum]
MSDMYQLCGTGYCRAHAKSQPGTYHGPDFRMKCSRSPASMLINSGSNQSRNVTRDRPFALPATTSTTAKPAAVETAHPRNLPARHVRLHPQTPTATPHRHPVHPAPDTGQRRLHIHQHRPFHRKERGISRITRPVFEHSFDNTWRWPLKSDEFRKKAVFGIH